MDEEAQLEAATDNDAATTNDAESASDVEMEADAASVEALGEDAALENEAAEAPAPSANPTASKSTSDYDVIENAPVAVNPETDTQAITGGVDKLPLEGLAQMETDKTVLFFGTVPLLVVSLLALIGVALYYFRRGKNWNELGEAMRLDPESDKAPESGFTTRDMAEMDPTKPSQRLSGVSQAPRAGKKHDRDDDD